MDCTWLVKAPVGATISLEFQLFNFEESSNCVNDYLAIYDGPTENYPLVNVFCGGRVPAKIISTRNSLFLRMKTNGRINKYGFAAIYKQITPRLSRKQR